MKRRVMIIILVFLMLFVIGGVLFVNSKKLDVKFEDNIEVSINTKVYNIDFVKNIKNGTLVTKKKVIDTSKLGVQTIKISIKDYFGKKSNYTYKINVYDSEAPTINFNKELITEEGVEIDLLKDVIVKDNSNEVIDVLVSGEYNFNKANSYILYYRAKDSSGNEKKEEFTLKVNAKKIVEVPKVEEDVNKKIEQENKNNEIKEDKTFITSKGFSGYTKNGLTYIDGVLIVNKTYSLPSNYAPGLTSETKAAFNKMQEAATLEGLNIYLSSGFRAYNTQNNLYNRYVNRDGKAATDTYSARPGHSEHQSGLAFDVNQINDTFNDTAEAKWLANNCHKYGFILRYPKGKTNETGYKYESWHFRYVGVDLATKLYNSGDWITLESYFGITSEYSY